MTELTDEEKMERFRNLKIDHAEIAKKMKLVEREIKRIEKSTRVDSSRLYLTFDV